MARSKKLVKKAKNIGQQKLDRKDRMALRLVKEQSVKAIESEILDAKIISDIQEDKNSIDGLLPLNIVSLDVEDVDDSKDKPPARARDMLEQIMFRLPRVDSPLIGTPKQVQIELDAMAKKMQRQPGRDSIFDKIHLYMHGYLINVVLKKFPFIRGLQTADIYQETLIALRFKAIPGFKYGKGMSFLNFAKMCIRRHLITLLHTSKNRKRDQSINQAISLDSSPAKDDDDDYKITYANIIADSKDSADKVIETTEAYEVTKMALLNFLSDFEKTVLLEYLSNSSYQEISKNISTILRTKSNTKSIDNALIRIRKKALRLLRYSKKEDLPIFLPKR